GAWDGRSSPKEWNNRGNWSYCNCRAASFTRVTCSAIHCRSPNSASCCASSRTGPGNEKGRLATPSCSLTLERWSLCGSTDRNTLGLGLFRHDALEIDDQQAIVERCYLDLDVIGQAERQLEGALGDRSEEHTSELQSREK